MSLCPFPGDSASPCSYFLNLQLVVWVQYDINSILLAKHFLSLSPLLISLFPLSLSFCLSSSLPPPISLPLCSSLPQSRRAVSLDAFRQDQYVRCEGRPSEAPLCAPPAGTTSEHSSTVSCWGSSPSHPLAFHISIQCTFILKKDWSGQKTSSNPTRFVG